MTPDFILSVFVSAPVATEPHVSFKQETVRLLSLGLPMMVAQGGLILTGLVDTWVVGQVSSFELAGVALGNAVVNTVIVIALGLVMGLDPLASQAEGAGRPEEARKWLTRATGVAALVCIPVMIATWIASFGPSLVGVEDHLVERGRDYVYSRLPGTFFQIWFVAQRGWFSARGRTAPIVVAVIFVNIVNYGLNVWFVQGLGWGAVGAGIASSLVWVVLTLVLWPLCGRSTTRPDMKGMLQIARLGFPIGLQLLAEVGIFAFMSILVGRHGEHQLSGHQISIQVFSLIFMIGVGLSVASTTRVGYWIGAGNPRAARQSGRLAGVLGGVTMAVIGGIIYLFSDEVAAGFAPGQPLVQEAAVVFLHVGALFGLADGVQVVMAGALRGAADVRLPFYANLVGHWAIGLPTALLLLPVIGPAAYWWGLVVGLVAVSLALVIRFEQRILQAKAIIQDEPSYGETSSTI